MESLSGTDREGVSPAKLYRCLKLIFGKKILGADAFLDRFTDFDVEALRELTHKSLLNVLLDVDDCIAPAYGPIPDENLAHVEHLQSSGVGVGIYSNCKGTSRLAPLRGMGVQVYNGKFAKPAPKGFIEACRMAGFDPKRTWMVGDNPMTDGGAAGVLEGMAFIRPIERSIEEPRQNLTFRRRIHLPFLRYLRKIAIDVNLEGNDRIIRSADLMSNTGRGDRT